ncbi:MAG: bifunctional (p)ppGpp synthetase/guanosine-3',5'-bis(diphosphate) 3'-pyrophosphohydrolase [Neisseriaceae bacterium]|nr:bifunctional (p)ppGpp synthetase/guanosine-3',5'-bis(diphosphate) 3'-pyrophosphohydrolase [Neisseriaceae bacterium]
MSAVVYDPLSQAAKDKLFQAASYLKPEEINWLLGVCDYAFQKHDGVTRQSGEPYITHPIAVATEVTLWRMDAKAIAAALLHDVLEDTSTTKEEMANAFGTTVADIVDGLSKLDKITYENYIEHQAESFRKLILAMVKDLRILAIKLADRLHNMRTLGSMRPEKCRRIAKETLEIHAQLANRIGMNHVYHELQDLSFRYLYPHRYQVLTKTLHSWRKSSFSIVADIMRSISIQLVSSNIEGKIFGREKNLYGIFTKMRDQHLRFEEIMDIYGFRIIVHTVSDCYRALGALHALYKPHPGKIKDYIAIPKSNGYQSLHTTLIGPKGVPIEVQIRTQEMDEIAEIGMLGHWLYKSKDNHQDLVQIRTQQWLENIMDLQRNSDNALDFAEHIKVDLFPNEVYVFTPQGKIIVLPTNATPVDFAYTVHTDIGDHCIAAKVNNQLVPLRHVLSMGDTVEIITNHEAHPNPSWLSFVVSSRARSAIRNRLKNMDRENAMMLGEKLLQKALQNLLPEALISSEDVKEKYLLDLQQKNMTFEDVLYDVGMRRTMPIRVAMHIAELAGKHLGNEVKLSPIKISGGENGNISLSECCHPIAGDAICAVLLPEQGLIIHRDICPNLRKIPADNVFEADWADFSLQRQYNIPMAVYARDGHGLLATIASTISSAQGNIMSVETPTQKQEVEEGFIEFIFELRLSDLQQFNTIQKSLLSIPSILKVTRL